MSTPFTPRLSPSLSIGVPILNCVTPELGSGKNGVQSVRTQVRGRKER